MNSVYRLSKENLLECLGTWDEQMRSKILVVACGGTALTLLNHKESTKDVDLLIPDPKHYDSIVKIIEKLRYKEGTGNGYIHPQGTWLFDLYRGQTIFQTELLDPVQEPGNHRVIKEYKMLTLGCLNSNDLIISKMFRGTKVDVEDCILLLKSENINLQSLAERYRETADYYYNPAECKRNLGYLTSEMERQGIESSALKEMSAKWKT